MAASSSEEHVENFTDVSSPMPKSFASGCSKVQMSRGCYQNPWPTWRTPKLWGLVKFMFINRDLSGIPSQHVLDQTLPVEKPDLSQFNSSPEFGVRHMWIGHASSLVQFDGITLLTDPIFSDRCSPSQWFGAKRFRPTPCTVEELPKVDCVVISHNHYDHLDYGTVVALHKRFGDELRWYVPKGMKAWMNARGCKNVVELLWWDENIFQGKEGNIKFVCTPSQHWSKRTAFDDNKALWSSWTVIGPKHRFYFAGDTGYCDVFKEIGERFGPFTLATIPVGAYHPREFLCPQHVDPVQAVDVHTDIKSQNSVGIHWGTFKMSLEHYLEPPKLIKEELEKRKMNLSEFVTVKHGEIKVFKERN